MIFRTIWPCTKQSFTESEYGFWFGGVKYTDIELEIQGNLCLSSFCGNIIQLVNCATDSLAPKIQLLFDGLLCINLNVPLPLSSFFGLLCINQTTTHPAYLSASSTQP